MLHNQPNKKHRQSLGKVKGKFVFVGVAAMALAGAVMTAEPVTVQAAEQTTNQVWRARTVEEVKTDLSQYDTLEELQNYEVVWGDTLWAISQAVGHSVEELADRFNIENPDLIFANYTFGEQKSLRPAVASGIVNNEKPSNTNAPTANGSTEDNKEAAVTDTNEEVSSDTDNNSQPAETAPETTPESETQPEPTQDLSLVDTNGNGIVTIEEAEAAGYPMPISKDHWLYPHMIDRDSDGMVGESE